MFVQVIEGKTQDADALRRQYERWVADVKPGAAGFLGSTGGVDDDGRAVIVARFASAEAARANSERPEQGQWWAETEKCFDGPVTFSESEDVDIWRGGGSDEAGFVQVMKSVGVDRSRINELDAQLDKVAATFRPDLLGGIRVWTEPDACIEVVYFTSEAEARENEKKGPPPELADQFKEMGELMADTEFIDLNDPILDGA